MPPGVRAVQAAPEVLVTPAGRSFLVYLARLVRREFPWSLAALVARPVLLVLDYRNDHPRRKRP